MNSMTSFLKAAAILVILSLPAYGQQVSEQAPGVKAAVNNVLFTVDQGACHLPNGQRVRLIGPFNDTQNFIVIAYDPPPPPNATSGWTGTYLATKLELGGEGEKPDLYLLEARARDQVLHPEETLHPAVMHIIEWDGQTPKEVEFICGPHPGGGATGAHNGAAHLQY